MTNNVDPDETAHYEPSRLDLHRLQKNMSRSAGSKGLIYFILNKLPHTIILEELNFRAQLFKTNDVVS